LSNNFSYPIEVARQGLTIYQTGDKFDLLINNRPFSHFYNSYDRENYDESYNKNSYGFSKSITNKLGDKYNKDKGLRNNLDREEYSTRAKYDGQRYSANDERVASWNDVDKAVSSHRRNDDYQDRRVVRSHTNFEDFGKGNSDGYYGNNRPRKNSFEEQEEFEYENAQRSKPQFAKSKTFGVNNNFQEFENRPASQQVKNPSSFDNFGDFSNFNKENKENVATSSSNRNPPPAKVQDFFDLDAADRKTNQGALDTNAQKNLFDFGAPEQPNMNKAHSQPAPTTITNELIDVSKPSLLTSINELYKNAPQPEPQIQTQAQPQVQSQNQGFDLISMQTENEKAKSEPSKKDLWNSNLVSLGDIGSNAKSNNQQQNNNQSNFIRKIILKETCFLFNLLEFNLPSNQGGMNTMNTMNNNNNMGGFNNNNMGMGMGMGMNMNMNMMNSNNYGNNNMMGMSNMGFQGNMGNMNSMNMGGFNNMGMNNGMGGFGGMNNNFGYNTNLY